MEIDKVLWAATLIFCAAVFFVTACRLMRITAAENYEKGKQDGRPIRLKNGRLVGRPK